MKSIPFVKMQGSGNDFILIDNRPRHLDPDDLGDFVPRVCRRSKSVGADGFILLEESDRADFRWHFFNADGSRAEMCGNGSRCAARWAHALGIAPAQLEFETDAGIIAAVVKGRKVKIRLTDPTSMEWDVRIPSNSRNLHLQVLNTGVPHAVEFVEDLEGCGVVEVGRYVRHHARFQPAGTNMNFAKVMERGRIAIRTYERGVEEETLACGTGAVASALASTELGFTDSPVDVVTRSGEVIQISFHREGDRYSGVHMEGETTLVYEGSLNEEAWE